MATKKKLLEAAAGSAGGAGLNVEEVFTNWLYTGDDSTTGQTIQNGVDYTDGEERLVWIKSRNDSKQSVLVDTVRGVNKNLSTANTTAEDTEDTLSAFTSNGFTVKHTTTGDYAYTVNRGTSPSGATTYASWTFRKAPKFFDVVTWTGDGVTGRTVSHNLGSVPGCIIVKRTDTTSDWTVYHRKADPTAPEDKWLKLNSASAVFDYPFWNDTPPTDTQFELNNNIQVNASGGTYVAYLFAHNDGDGEFGPTGDQDIIKCGSYSINASDHVEDLGFEPQWVMTKSTNISGQWIMVDNMRGMGVNREANQDKVLRANLYNAEETNNGPVITPTGFVWPYDGGNAATNGEQGIYIAIRRGPMGIPESASEVFDVSYLNNVTTAGDEVFTSNVTMDKLLYLLPSGGGQFIYDRMRGGNQSLQTSSTSAENSGGWPDFDKQTGLNSSTAFNFSSRVGLGWKRAPGFFDVVAYTGTGAGTTFNHNLGVVPEMIWLKNRSRSSTSWNAYHKDLESNGVAGTAMDCVLYPNLTNSVTGVYDYWGASGPSDTQVTLGTNGLQQSFSGDSYIAYLFASLDGVSKVGSYTGNGSTQTIDCGFSSGARFVLIKRPYSTSDWYVWDTERGIVAANDPHLSLNTTAAEVTTDDSIDPVSSGFVVNQVAATNINVSGSTYLFYAIA